ncbi:hypothetical protein OVA07_13305 [Novosphingobium sp. SL115]|uniref:hypothetical protein n=1 Tax=Novosphingobium sp. SL115 TaxID=2995150 RepID=UPI002276A6CB|nr:hypothetical protein [Novosphingobium sp. SL115]MCY1671980.1 hypothetical protein [Novosphingobium sp. SL115]
MSSNARRAQGEQRRRYIETTLASYPDIEPDAISELIEWFEKEAGIGDMARIMRSSDLKRAYISLKADQLDRLQGIRLFWSASLGMLVAAAATALMLGGI